MSDRTSPETETLADEFTAWVEQYALKVCPEGCLPTRGQEREINLFARVAIALRRPRLAQTPSLPEGWVVVPKEPTDAMCEAMLDRIKDAEEGRGAPFKWPDIEHMFDVYTDAIAASPDTSTDRSGK